MLAAVCMAFAQGARKPAPLPGVDPGGVMIALVGPGIDYTRPGLAERLARDGEGEIIGFDLVNRDRRPFCRVECEAQTEASLALLKSAPSSRIAVFKVDGGSLAAAALQMAVTAKAAIVVLDLPDDPQTNALLLAAADRFRDTLIIHAPRTAPAPPTPPADPATAPGTGETNRQPPLPPGNAASSPAQTATTQAPSQTSGQPSPPLEPNAAAAPAVPVSPAPPSTGRADNVIAARAVSADSTETSLMVAARLAAEAANVVATSPSTRGAALKARIEAPGEIKQ